MNKRNMALFVSFVLLASVIPMISADQNTNLNVMVNANGNPNGGNSNSGNPNEWNTNEGNPNGGNPNDSTWKYSGSGSITGEGDGKAVVKSKGTVRIDGSGTVFIKIPQDRIIEITTSGYGHREYLGNGWIMISGVGWARISNIGSQYDMKVLFYGHADSFRAFGRGTALFRGDWTLTTTPALRVDTSNNTNAEEIDSNFKELEKYNVKLDANMIVANKDVNKNPALGFLGVNSKNQHKVMLARNTN